MKGNGTKIAFIIGFLAISIYYLWPTAALYLEQNYVQGLPQAEQAKYKKDNAGKMLSLKERSLSMGLDLQGGMHVTLEVGTPKLVRELAGQYADSALDNAIDFAYKESNKQGTDFIDDMVADLKKNDPNARLSRYYRSASDDITRRSSNADVVAYLKKQRDSAVGRAIEIIRTRIDRYGVTEPSIVKQGKNRVAVELPGVANEERVRKLLKGTARLEFHLAANANDLNIAKRQIINYFNRQAKPDSSVDSTAQPAETNALLQVLNPRGRSEYVFGYSAGADTAKVNKLLAQKEVQNLLPHDTELMWGATPFQTTKNGMDLFELIGVKKQVELTGDVISGARVSFDPATNVPEVSMNMNSKGAREWSRITGANIGKPVVIVLDGYVYSYPNVQTKISSGRSSITGLTEPGEAQDLVNILLSGALPAPLNIVEERTVSATLGEASIKAGFYSTLAGLIIVAIFMIVYYHKGGAIADLALILNMVFILGILAAFRATLTLPGIAGIVLTIGMAVDANVLIFDRIREEQRLGKTMRAAIDSGYSNAMSAIIDANVTTFFIGVILYSFGEGPVKGFAVTLMAGIVSSLFSAIVITRVVVDYLTRDKSKEISFG